MGNLVLVVWVVFIAAWIWAFLGGMKKSFKDSVVYYDHKKHKEKNNKVMALSPYFMLDQATGVVVQKEGLLQKSYRFRGPDVEGYADNEKNNLVRFVNTVLMRKGTGWAWHFEAQKFQVREYAASEFPTKAHMVIEEERKDTFEAEHRFFDSDYYLTITYAPPKELATKAGNWFRNEGHTTAIRSAIDNFVSQADTVAAELGQWLAVEAMDASTTLSFLHSSFSWNRFPLGVPDGWCYLDAILFDTDITLSGDDVLIIGDYVSKVITVNAFPARTFAGILDGLNRLGLEYRWTTRWIAYDSQDAKKYIEVYQKKYFGERKSMGDSMRQDGGTGMINKGALALMDQADDAAVQIDRGDAAFGKLSMQIMISQKVFDGDIRQAAIDLKDKEDLVVKAVNSAGFTAFAEKSNLLEAWRGMMPGNVYANVRRFMFGSDATTDMLPITSVWAGREVNRHTERVGANSTALMMTATESTTPFYFNINYEDLLHAMIIGPTGAGKTTFLLALMLSFGKYRNPQTKKWARVFAFDVDRSMRQVGMAVGATRYEPGVKGSIAFQPLLRLDDEADIAWATEFIELLFTIQNLDIKPRMLTAITTALRGMKDMEPRRRTMSAFKAHLQYEEDGDHVLDDYLKPYCSGGAYGDLFDAEDAPIDLDFMTIFEMRTLLDMGDRVVFPGLKYLFRQIELSLDGTMTLCVLDEAWNYFKHAPFRTEIINILNTGRKKNLGVVLCTQNLAEVARQADVASSLLTNCPTRIFLPHEGALEMADVYESFGLTMAEIQTIARSKKKRDYIFKSPEGVRKFQLALGPKTLNLMVAFSDPAGHKVMDQLEKSTPEAITDFFLEKGRHKASA